MNYFRCRLIVYALLLSCFGYASYSWLEADSSRSTDIAEKPPSREPVVVGPSVLINLQNEKPLVFDLRANGEALPGAFQIGRNEKPPQNLTDTTRPIVIVGEENEARRWATAWPDESSRYIIPERMLRFPSPRNVRRISGAALHAQKSRFHLIDLAEPEEWQMAHVAGSRRVSHLRFWNGDRSFLPPRSEPLVIMCPTGARSWPVVEKLANEGYDVYDLRGGMLAWLGAELPTESEVENE